MRNKLTLGKKSSWTGLERRFIYETLRQNNWNRTATAAQLDMHTTTLWRKIKNLNINSSGQDEQAKRE